MLFEFGIGQLCHVISFNIYRSLLKIEVRTYGSVRSGEDTIKLYETLHRTLWGSLIQI